MSLIEKLVKIRFDNFILEFDISISDLTIYNINIRKNNWDIVKQKLIKRGYVTKEVDAFDCYLVIKNIIWKNITSYEIIDNQWHIYMYHNAFTYINQIYHCLTPVLSYKIALGIHSSYYLKQKNNCDILQTKIINYIMVLDTLVTQHMISDLVNMIKMYIFDVMLEL